MMRWGLSIVGLLTVSIMIATGAVAQDPLPDRSPSVTFEDVTVDQVIQPLGDAVEVPVVAQVGCQAAEAPETTTTATFEVNRSVTGISATFSQASVQWTNSAGNCTGDASTHEAAVVLTLTADRRVTAFEDAKLTVDLLVTKQPPAGEAETYGPYMANVTATPGYLPGVTARLDERVARLPANQTAVFSGTVQNTANGQTQVTINPVQPPETLEIVVEPESLVLEPGEEASYEVQVSLVQGSVDAVLSETVALEIVGTSTADQAADQANGTQELQIHFEPVSDGALPVPGAGPVVALLAGLAVAGACRR